MQCSSMHYHISIGLAYITQHGWQQVDMYIAYPLLKGDTAEDRWRQSKAAIATLLKSGYIMDNT